MPAEDGLESRPTGMLGMLEGAGAGGWLAAAAGNDEDRR